jgi:hypothetical protein
VSDKDWKTAKDLEANWTAVDFNDSTWQQAYEIGQYGKGRDDKVEIFVADPGHPSPFVRKEFPLMAKSADKDVCVRSGLRGTASEWAKSRR